MKETRAYWLEHLLPALLALRNAVKEDASGLVETVAVESALQRLEDAVEEFRCFWDDEG